MKIIPILIYLITINYVRCKNVHLEKENIKVTIDQGTLIGRETQDFYNDKYYIFHTIPYAKAPVGTLRFKAPEPPVPWNGIYDATKPKPACPQLPFLGERPEYSEDCLFLNVHTKLTQQLKPVMVWIHGGAFDVGSINTKSRGSQWLIAEDIVLVDIQYRLNIFGFLSIDDPKYDIRGNAGLKDQVMGLKWVQKNIKHFGGDPNQVTIFGESAGGASVHLLYVSPLAKGLFHRAIAQSGSGANTWVHSLNKYPQLAKALNCTLNSLDETVKCINGSSTDVLLNASPILKKNPNNTIVDDMTMNVLTIEDVNSKDPFMTDTIEANIRRGEFNKVPLIMGICANESVPFITDRRVGPDFTEADYAALIPKDINVEKCSEEAFNIGKQIKQFYYGNRTPSYFRRKPYIRYLSDLMFIQKMYEIAKLQVSVAPDIPVYFYNFNYNTKLNWIGYPRYIPHNYVFHSQDLQYLFYNNASEVPELLNPQSDEYIGMYRMIKLWTTFAKSKNGDPNPDNDDPLFNNITWKPMEPNNSYYLYIHQNLELQTDLYNDRMTFWDNLYRKYGKL